ncbi:MAG: NAD-dependent malic enzyme [Actinomycetales bacterium]
MRNPAYDLDPDAINGTIKIRARGRDVLNTPMINRGTAFTIDERRQLGLNGLLPSGVTTLDNQLRRVYEQFRRSPSPLAKNIYLAGLRDRNEVLFYRLLTDHIEEMMPIVYTPTIGEAIERYSHEYNRSKGVFLSIDQPDLIEESLQNYRLNPDDVDLIVATDSEGILGIGDQGVGGVQIAIGKLAVYIAAAGIHPQRVVPVVLDTGTDNLGLLNSEMYIGERHGRVRGERYNAFLDQFVETVSRVFPNAMLHWEDFGSHNAHPVLQRYRDKVCTFNDDIQGTAAVALAAVLAGVHVSTTPLKNHRVVIFGAGTAGVGIADLLRDTMVEQGLSAQEASNRFYALGRNGLLFDDMKLLDYQTPYARSRSEISHWELEDPNRVSLEDVVREVKPTILIGTSTVGGAFTEEIVRQMAAHCERPIIMPMSNPTPRAEATPANLLAWTDGKALVATGSPFDPVRLGNVQYQIAQANNALIFPGLGLGVAASGASRVTDRMISASAQALAGLTKAYRPGAALLPGVGELRLVSATVAIAVAQAAEQDGVAKRMLEDPVGEIYARMWQPVYPRFEPI